MPETAARLLRLLSLLQRRPSWGGDELAERLEIGTRTLRRDVERLRGLGYMVDASPGAGGGYRLGTGAQLPPLLLDDDEATAVAVVLGVSAGAPVPGLEQGALGALAKLDRLLPPHLRSQLEALRASTVALVRAVDPVPAEHLAQLARACDGHRLVHFAYRSRDGLRSERRVEPHRLVATERRWYLVAHDLDRNDWRTFRVDRIESVEMTGHGFVPRPLEDAGRMVAEAISATGYRHRALVRLAVSAAAAARLIGPSVGMLEPDGDGESCLLSLGVDDFDWLAGYLVGLGVDFEALAPPELRTHLAALAARIAGVHGTAPLADAEPAGSGQ